MNEPEKPLYSLLIKNSYSLQTLLNQQIYRKCDQNTKEKERKEKKGKAHTNEIGNKKTM